MKKLLALFLVAVMAFSCLALTSCKDEEEKTSAAESVEDEESATSSDATSEEATSSDATSEEAASSDAASEEAASSDAASEDAASEDSASEDAASEDAASEDSASEDAASEDAASEDVTSEDTTSDETTSEIPGSVEDTDSYKYYESIDMTKGYTIKADITESFGFKVVLSVLGDNVSMIMEIAGESVRVIIKDGKAYMIDDASKSYVVSDATGEEIPLDSLSIENLFKDLEFVSSNNEEVNGVVYKVDVFKTLTGDEEKIYMDAEGKIVMVFEEGVLAPYEITNTIPEGCFDIPADYTEAEF